MRIKLLFVAVLVLLCSSPYLRSNANKVKTFNDYHVQNYDTGIYYITIQEAINAPETLDGHRILLDLYVFEEHIVVNKSIELDGAVKLGLPSPPYPDITTIKGDGTGTIVTIRALNVTLHSLKIMNGTNGIVLEEAHGGILQWLTICDNTENGLYLLDSRNCTLKYIDISNNRYNFGVEGSELEDFLHTVISSTTNGKPIYYLINEHEISLTEDCGYIAAINCTTITVQNQNLTHNRQGILLAYTRYSVIRNANIDNNLYGIYIRNSDNNIIYHNNLIKNSLQVYSYDSANDWDDGYPSGGNYWSDYIGTDGNQDGLGIPNYPIDLYNIDYYPLMGPFNTFDAGIWNGVAYHVDVVSNSTVSDFYFSPDEGAFVKFNVTGESGTTGFCRVTIPKGLLWVEDGWTITVGGEPITNYTIIPDENCTYLYFTYSHTTKAVIIQGTNVIPEFPPATLLPLFIMATLMAVIVYRRKHSF